MQCRTRRTRQQALQFGEIVLTLREVAAGGVNDKIAAFHRAVEPWQHRCECLMVLTGEERGRSRSNWFSNIAPRPPTYPCREDQSRRIPARLARLLRRRAGWDAADVSARDGRGRTLGDLTYYVT